MAISARYNSSHNCCTWWLNSPAREPENNNTPTPLPKAEAIDTGRAPNTQRTA